MPTPNSSVGFGTPFQAQLDFFRAKLNLPSERWDDIWQQAHDRAFIVAGAMKADLLNDLRDAVEQSVSGQLTYQEFHKQFLDIAKAHGWINWTGSESEAGQAWRTRIVYQTNLLTSHAAGRYNQLTSPSYLQRFPYWVYHHRDGVAHPRPLHVSWNGLTLHHSHPFWQTHFPPNGWLCHCWVTSTDEAGYQQYLSDGGSTQPPEGWDALNAKTGAPIGIDKGWAYAPGASTGNELRALVDRKVATYAPAISKDFLADVSKIVEPVFVAQKTVKDAAAWAVSRNLVDFSDYSGLHIDVANACNLSLFNHINEFPQLRKNQEFIGTAQAQFARWHELRVRAVADRLIQLGYSEADALDMASRGIKKPKVNGSSYAHSWRERDVSGIAVNKKWGGDLQSFEAALQRDVAVQWHPSGCDTVKSIIDHEFGHQLDALLDLRNDSEIKALYNDLTAQQGVKNAVSSYAATNIAEFIAEAWAESCNRPDPRDAARVVARIVRARYRLRHSSQ